MKILYWNVYIGRSAASAMERLRAMIKEHDPEIVGLGEASKIQGLSENVPGYKAFWLPETYRGRGDTIVLVRNDVVLKDWYWVRFKAWWTGPKHGLPQGPKRFWAGRVKDDRLGIVRVSVGHWGFNTALPECEAWCVSWFKKPWYPWRKSVHLGDLNMGPGETGEFCKRFNGKHEGIGIDRAMFKNCVVTARNLGMHGSDHPAVLFNVGKK
jgi:hypothetical protein